MKKCLVFVCLGLFVFGGLIHTAQATPMYSATVPLFVSGLDLDTGAVQRDPKIIMVVFEEDLDLELDPAIANLVDFSPWPNIDLHFVYDPANAAAPFGLVAEYLTQVSLVTKSSFEDLAFDDLDTLAWQEVSPAAWLSFAPEDVLVFETAEHLFWAFEVIQFDGLEPLVLNVKQLTGIPEPASLLLLGLGVLAGLGLVRWRKHNRSDLHRLLLLALLLSVLGIANPAFGTTGFVATYGTGTSSGIERPYNVTPCPEGGYLLVGDTILPDGMVGEDFFDTLVLKLREDGEVEWQRSYGGNSGRVDWLDSAVVASSEKGYLLVGATTTSSVITSFPYLSYDGCILKLSEKGDIQWLRAWDTWGMTAAVQSSKGGYLVVGGGNHLITLSEIGEIQWQRSYGSVVFNALILASDGGYIGAGKIDQDGWVVKLNEDGEIQWQRSYGGAEEEKFLTITPSMEGGYLVAGVIGPHDDYDLWMLKLDQDGEVEWQRSYYHGAHEGILHRWDLGRLLPSPDGGYIVNGNDQILKLNETGDVQWFRLYDLPEEHWHLFFVGLAPTPDGGYLAVGNDNGDGWVLKLDKNGNISGCSPHNAVCASLGVSSNIEVTTTTTAATVAETYITPAESQLIAVEPPPPMFSTETTLQTTYLVEPSLLTFGVSASSSGSGKVRLWDYCGSAPCKPEFECTEQCPLLTEVAWGSGAIPIRAMPDEGSCFAGWKEYEGGPIIELQGMWRVSEHGATPLAVFDACPNGVCEGFVDQYGNCLRIGEQ